jgi:hypothetical protein
MSKQTHKPIFLARAPRKIDPDLPWDGDLCNRRPLGQWLTLQIDRLPDGGVIAVDAPWGGGKSWFGKNWYHQLLKDGHRAIWFDAFESDYVDDPFLLVASEFTALSKRSTSAPRDFRESAARAAKLLAPTLGKALARGAGRALFGEKIEGQIEEIIDKGLDALTDNLDEVILARIEELENRKRTIESFRLVLKDVATSSSNGKPLVFFVDELDRCRPTFAVQFLERIKHFFEVPGVVFVLLLNRAHLEETIKGMYGAGIDANMYLQKFITASFVLPQGNSATQSSTSFLIAIVDSTMKRVGLSQSEAHMHFCQCLSYLSYAWGISYREIERIVTRATIAPFEKMPSGAICYIAALQVVRPKSYQALLRGTPHDHDNLQVELAASVSGITPNSSAPTAFFAAVHAVHIMLGSASATPPSESRGLVPSFFDSDDKDSLRRILQRWCSNMDMKLPPSDW